MGQQSIRSTASKGASEELLRTLIDAELTARGASNARARLKTAGFPVTKNLDEFDVKVSSIPKPTCDCLASLEWIAAEENACPVADDREVRLPVAVPARPRVRRSRHRRHRRVHRRDRDIDRPTGTFSTSPTTVFGLRSEAPFD